LGRRGRPSNLEKQIRLSQILNLWRRKEDVLTFSEIHKKLVKMGRVSNIKYRASTRRILKMLIEKGYLEQIGRGKYRLKVSPKPFQVTDLINEVRERYGDEMIYEWGVGGHLWILVEGVLFGLPRNIEENPIYKAILEVLLTRLAHIFDAIVALGVAAKLSGDAKSASIPYEAVREFVLNSLPHIIGEYSGIDGDGLPAEDIVELYRVLVKHIPREVNGQPILIDVIRKYLDVGNKLLGNATNVSAVIDMMLIESGESREVWRKIRELKKIVLVAYPPRHLIDENEDERELYELLRYSIENDNSDAMLLAHMRIYDENIVERVMNYLKHILSEERREKLVYLYKLARAGMILDSIVETYLSFKEKKGKPKYIKYEEEILSELRKRLDRARRRGYTLEDMIKGIWLSNWSLSITPRFTHFHYSSSKDIVNFIKESIKETLGAIGVNVPRNVNYLVEEGHELMKALDERLRKDVKKMAKNIFTNN